MSATRILCERCGAPQCYCKCHIPPPSTKDPNYVGTIFGPPVAGEPKEFEVTIKIEPNYSPEDVAMADRCIERMLKNNYEPPSSCIGTKQIILETVIGPMRAEILLLENNYNVSAEREQELTLRVRKLEELRSHVVTDNTETLKHAINRISRLEELLARFVERHMLATGNRAAEALGVVSDAPIYKKSWISLDEARRLVREIV